MVQMSFDLSTVDRGCLRASLYLHTKPGSKIRRLGEMLLNGPMTTGEITAAFLGTPSIFCQMRRTLRGMCKWRITTEALPNTEQVLYRLEA